MTSAKLQRDRTLRLTPWIAMAIAAPWLLSPMFFAQHLEGYTTNLKAIALMANRGGFMGQDLMSPALTEFLYYTRLGVIALLQVSDLAFGQIGDWDFRGLMILSFALLTGSSIFIAQRLGNVSALAAVAALLLIPGFSEAAFYFNDNLPSAAFAVAGMALVVRWDRPVVYLISGGLAAAAILCRLDGILLAPAVAGVAWLRHGTLRPLAARWLAASAGFLLTLLAAAILYEATPIDALITARAFSPGPGYFTTLIILGFYLGAPGALILPIGLLVGVRGLLAKPDKVRWLVVLLVHPSLILAAALKLSTETRYIYPLLAPYVALYAGRGIETLLEGMKGRHRRASLIGLILLATFVLMPPLATAVRDGPRSPVGRIWMPALWLRWENTMAESLRRVQALVNIADAHPRLLLLSTHFNDDFFLKQRLLAAGYQVQPAETMFSGCSGFSVYSKNHHLVAHIRTERQYGQVRTSKSRLRALLIDRSLSCPALLEFNKAYLTLWSDDKRVTSFEDTIDPRLIGSVLPRLGPPPALSAPFTPASIFRWPFWQVQTAGPDVPRYQLQGMFHAYLLSHHELRAIAGAARSYLTLPMQPNALNDDHPVTYEDYRRAYRPRCKDPDKHGLAELPLCMR